MSKVFKTLAVVICAHTMCLNYSMAQDGKEPLSGKPPAGTKASVTDFDYQIKYQRAFEAIIWSMPMTAGYGYRRGAVEGAGYKDNDIIYMSGGATPLMETATSNSTTPYIAAFVDLRKSPVILEIPPASAEGSIYGQVTDAWQVTIADIGPSGEDGGKGGKYLFTAPGYDKPIPGGYFHIVSTSNRLFFAFRSIVAPGKTEKDAIAYVKKLRVYDLDQASNPPEQKYIDILKTRIPALPYYDERAFKDIYDVINAEPVREQDKVMMGMLKTLGIEKSKPYNPDEETLKAMRQGAIDAYYYMEHWFDHMPKDKYYWPDRHYASLLMTDENKTFTWVYDDYIDLIPRAVQSFWCTNVPKKLSDDPATQYMMAMADREGNPLQAGKLYKIDIPAKMPVKQFWALTVYDFSNMSFIYSNTNRTTLSSYDLDEMKKNSDGSVTIYVGPKAPGGLESNWIPTVGKRPIPAVRFYGPTQDFNNKTFKLPDFELVN